MLHKDCYFEEMTSLCDLLGSTYIGIYLGIIELISLKSKYFRVSVDSIPDIGHLEQPMQTNLKHINYMLIRVPCIAHSLNFFGHNAVACCH